MMTATQQAAVQATLAVVTEVADATGPTGVLAAGVVNALATVVMNAANSGVDVTPDQLAAAFSADDAAKLADTLALAAKQASIAETSAASSNSSAALGT